MLFHPTLLIYIIISAVFSVLILVTANIYIKTETHKKNFLKFFALITIAIHFSSLWVDLFTKGEAVAEQSMLLPIYPCNVISWLLIACAFVKNHKSKVGKILYEFTFFCRSNLRNNWYCFK